MIRYLLILIGTMILTTEGMSQDDKCKEVALISKEAKMIHTKFDDPTNALNLLNASSFRSIIYRKPNCMSEKEYLKYLDLHVLYMVESAKDSGFGSYTRNIQEYVKKHPQHLYFLYSLGRYYENQYRSLKRMEYREKALETYKKYIQKAREKNIKVDKKVLAFIKHGGLVKSKNGWGKYLNPSKTSPLGVFKAFYINTHEPKKVIASEVVENIAVNYPYNQFHGIPSASFGGYWVGRMHFDKESKKMIYIAQSNATTRVIIDGYVVYDGGSRAAVAYTFKKGVHTIEVEHINRWHTTELSVKIMDKIEKYNMSELKKKLKPFVKKNTKFIYVGVYESDKKDTSIKLKIQKSKEPVILLLESQRAVIWNIDNFFKTKIAAMIVHSSSPEATFNGDTQGIKIFYSNSRVGNGYSSGLATQHNQNCKCIAGHYTCGESAGFSASYIPQEFSKKIRGFSGKYAATILAVPELDMSDEKYKEIEEYTRKISKMRAECTKNRRLKPDELFH